MFYCTQIYLPLCENEEALKTKYEYQEQTVVAYSGHQTADQVGKTLPGLRYPHHWTLMMMTLADDITRTHGWYSVSVLKQWNYLYKWVDNCLTN